MEHITTKSVGPGFVNVEKEFVLEDTSRTRIVFVASMHEGGIRGSIIRYRKALDGTCEQVVPVNFNSLHEDEGIRIQLSTKAVSELYAEIQKLRQLLDEKGIQYGENDYTIADGDAIVINDRAKGSIIQKMIAANWGEDVWNQLAKSSPQFATALAYSRIQEDRKIALDHFATMLQSDLHEAEWQSFFEKNTWIFGYGLRYQFLSVVAAQPNYEGAAITGTGGQRGDFLMATEAETRFTCLVEIKKPTTKLLQLKEYRNGAWGISNDLAGAISQVQVNSAQWEISSSRNDRNHEQLAGINTIAPRRIIVIGNTAELDNWDKKNSFERFRTELRNPEIITYDELFERAKFIVGETVSTESTWDDIPF